MTRPLALASVIFSAGIFFEQLFKVPFIRLYLLAALFLILTLATSKKLIAADIFLALLIFFLGAAHLKGAQALAKSHISHYAFYQNNNLYTLNGFITNEPEIKMGKTAFILRAETLRYGHREVKVSGDTLVYAQPVGGLRYGDNLILSGILARPFNRPGSGKSSYRDYLAHQGVYSIMKASRVMKLDSRRGSGLKKLALYFKNKTEGVIFKYIRGPAAGIVDAMLLGEKKSVPPFIYDSMIKTGTVHILVVSGFNVGLIFLVITLLLKMIRLPREARIFLAAPLLLLYCLVTGATNPVVRATVMAVVYLFSYLCKREADIYNGLALAALVILILNPQQLFDIGFQLSFASVMAIVYLYPRLESLVGVAKLKIHWLKFILDGFLVSLAAWIGVVGLSAYYFKSFAPVTVLANVFIVPLATLINLCGLSLILAALISPALAYIFALPCQFLALLLINMNKFLLSIPGAYWHLT